MALNVQLFVAVSAGRKIQSLTTYVATKIAQNSTDPMISPIFFRSRIVRNYAIAQVLKVLRTSLLGGKLLECCCDVYPELERLGSLRASKAHMMSLDFVVGLRNTLPTQHLHTITARHASLHDLPVIQRRCEEL
jgi:hypothetical protein